MPTPSGAELTDFVEWKKSVDEQLLALSRASLSRPALALTGGVFPISGDGAIVAQEDETSLHRTVIQHGTAVQQSWNGVEWVNDPPVISDGDAPTVAPVITVQPFAVGAVEARWVAVPNDDQVVYKVYASLTSPVVTDDAHLVGQTTGLSYRTAVADGAALPIPAGGATAPPVYMRVVPTDNDGVGPVSNEASASPVAADAFITAAFIAAIEIQAQQIIAGNFEANLGILGRLSVGGYVDIDGVTSSITIYADTAHQIPLIQLRPEGSVFRGKVIADDVSVLNGLILQGVQSQIATNAGLTIMNAIADPNGSPTVSSTTQNTAWPAVPAGYVMRGMNWDSVAGHYIRLLVPTAVASVPGGCRVQTISTAGALVSSVTLANTAGTEQDMNSICRLGDHYFTMVKKSSTDFVSGNWVISKFLVATGAVVISSTANQFGFSEPVRPAIGTVALAHREFSNLDLVAFIPYNFAGTANRGRLRYYSSDDPSVNYADEYRKDIYWPDAEKNAMFVGIDNFDRGARRTVIAGATTVRSYTGLLWGATPAIATGEEWTAAAATTNGGLAFQGGNYYTVDGTTRRKYSTFLNSASRTVDVVYQDVNGSDYTLESPVGSAVIPNRYFVLASIPPNPTGITSAKFYAAHRATSGGVSGMNTLLGRTEAIVGERGIIFDAGVAGSGNLGGLRTVLQRALTSNVATLTVNVAHGYTVGQVVRVSGVGSPFDGTFTVSAVPTTTTFSYAKTGTDVASGAAPAGAFSRTRSFSAQVPGWLKTQVGGFELNGDGTGRWPLMTQPHFRAEHSAGTNIGTSSENAVSWGSIQASSSTNGVSDFTLSNAERDITVAQAGVYQIFCTVGYSGNNAGVRYAYIYVNGVLENVANISSATTNITVRCSTGIGMRLEAGDVVSIRGFQNSGSTLTFLTGPSTAVSLSRTGA